MKRILILLAVNCLCFSLSTPSRAESAADDSSGLASLDYETVYLEEKREASPYPWKVGVLLGAEFGDAYLNMQSATLTALRGIGGMDVRQHLAAGVSVNKFFVQDGTLTQSLNNSQIVSVNAARPAYSAFGVLEFTPFLGNINLILNDPVELALAIRVGAGTMFYQANQSYPAAMWSLCPQVGVSRRVGLELGAGQEIESPFNGGNRVARWMGQAGAFFRF